MVADDSVDGTAQTTGQVEASAEASAHVDKEPEAHDEAPAEAPVEVPAGEPVTEEEFDALFNRVRMAIHLARLDEARELATKMLASRPMSTTAHEVMGDVLAASNRLPQAEAEFRRAAELEPANSDAQRKLGEVVLRRSAPEFQRHLLETDLAGSNRAMHKPDPQAAALRSAVFPGLGQLYNGDYERGLGLAVGAMILLGVAINGFVSAFPGVLSGISHHATGGAQPSGYGWAELLLGGIAYAIVYCYSIWNAARSARDSAASAELYRPPTPSRR